jgi:iron complex outermembrane receptor protein
MSIQSVLTAVIAVGLITVAFFNGSVSAAELEEVVVSSRKVDENEQTVPISMVVNTGQELEQAQIVDFQDLTKITPGLTITSGDPTSSSIKIRGVGLPYFGLAADPGVVITVDEFPQSRIGAVFGAFLDVQQVEVLKGPQGTLYGRNAPSGVISIWSNKPDYNGIHGRVDLSASSYDTFTGEAAVNLPLVDEILSVRLAYIHTESDGYTNRAKYETVNTAPDAYTYIYSGDKVKADEIDGDTTRATILFEPVDNLAFTTRFSRTDYNNGLISKVADGPMIYQAETFVVDQTGDLYIADRDANLIFQDNKDYSEYTLKDSGLRVEWTPEAGMLVSLSQYQDFDTELSQTDKAMPTPLAVPRLLSSQDDLYTQELRWHSNIGDDLDYLVGVYYAKQDLTVGYEQLENNSGQLILVSGDSESKTYAMFANFDYSLNEHWSFSLGGRYNDETESIDSNLDLSALIPGGGGDIYIGQFDDEITDDNFSHSFKIRYQHNENLLLYFAWDTAYKSGGYNPQLANTSDFFVGNENIATLENDLLVYPSEESEAWEIGVKSTWFDNTLLVNMALFYQDFDNFQNFQGVDEDRIGGFSLGSLINAVDEVNTQGVELDVSWVISDNWNASFTGSYADPSVDKWDTNLCDEDDQTVDPLQLYCPLDGGSRLNDDAKWSTNSQLGYRKPLDISNITFFTHLSWSYQGEGGGDYDDAYGTLDMNVGIDIDNWSLKVWSTNLLDEKSFTNRSLPAEDIGVDNFYLGNNIQPRMIGMKVIYTFGDE